MVERGIADPKVTRSTRVGSFLMNRLAKFVMVFLSFFILEFSPLDHLDVQFVHVANVSTARHCDSSQLYGG